MENPNYVNFPSKIHGHIRLDNKTGIYTKLNQNYIVNVKIIGTVYNMNIKKHKTDIFKYRSVLNRMTE